MKRISSIVSFLFVYLFSFGQEECGTVITEDDNLIIQQVINSSLINKGVGDSIVPIQFHIIGYSNGSSGIDSASVFNELSIINSYYTNAGIEFQHCGTIDYIFNDNYASFKKITDEVICNSNDVPNVLNIYFVPLLYRVNGIDTTALCGYAYSSSLTKNRVLMKNSCSTNGSTLAHEIGHYFSLAHTHSTSTGAELVNGSNCSISGDLICDTPADPQLSYSVVNASCIYSGTAQDANGAFYNPETRNMMSYSRKSCRNLFSPDQYTRMNAYLLNYRNYLVCPSFVSVKENTQEIQFSIAPNPVNAESYLFIKNNERTLTLSITDISGKLIYDEQIQSQNKIDISNFTQSSGVYFITLSTFTKRTTKKLIKY